MTDLEYELAMMAEESESVATSAGFLDKPERWKDELSSAYRKDHRWFEWAITEYLKGR